jgi:carbamoyltransferase
MGHDAAVAVLVDGRVQSLIERERRIRVKHAAIATIDDIDAALADAGVSIKDVDRIAVTTTQNWPFLFVEPDKFRFDYVPEDAADVVNGVGVAKAVTEKWSAWAKTMAQQENRGRTRLRNFQGFPDTKDLFGQLSGERPVDPSDPESQILFTQQFPYFPRPWADVRQSDHLRPAARELYGKTGWRQLTVGAFHIPILAKIHGRRIPGAVIPHHLAHAATAFYGSDADTAAVITHDGGQGASHYGHTGGIYCFGEGNRLYPIWFNHGTGGNMYRRIADACGLKGMGGPGKLMGLSPYGAPRFHDESWVGVAGDLEARHPVDPDGIVVSLYEKAWPYIRAALRAEQEAGVGHPIPSGDPLAAFSKDLAASIQRTFEAQTVAMAHQIKGLAGDLGFETETLCLTGGCALNCPANSRVWRESAFRNVFVPPTCDDSGLAIGGAFYLAHTLFDEPRAPQGAASCGSAYLGRRIDRDEVVRAVGAAEGVVVEEGLDCAEAAAADLVEGRIIGWYEGRSEIGPRALGHRSVVADPRRSDSWRRVNRVKNREQWRPLAPAVLVERVSEWFEGAPPVSPHMLFTATVTRGDVPAITHVDRSARVQTVDESCGGFRDLITAFDAKTGVPVVMNTSLNGRGEPIVESPGEAVAMFRNSELDVLYLDGYRLTRDRSETSS